MSLLLGRNSQYRFDCTLLQKIYLSCRFLTRIFSDCDWFFEYQKCNYLNLWNIRCYLFWWFSDSIPIWPIHWWCLPTFQKQEPLTPEYQKCNMKIRNESIFFITDNGILEHSLNNFSEKTLIEFPEQMNPNLMSLQILESTGALFMFQK